MKNHLSCIIYLLLIINMVSCANLNSTSTALSNPYAPAKTESILSEESNEYVLSTGDIIDIKFYYNPELNEKVTIRPDGRISLQIIDEVKATGLTPSELDKVLTDKYSNIIHDPQLTVIVRGLARRSAYVGGEVMAPKVVLLGGNMTVLQAILDAGGFRETACPASVIVISRNIKNEPEVRKLDLKKVMSGRSAKNDIILRSFDIVYVPKSSIANVNKFVDQYINKIVPDFVSVGFTYSRYKGRQKGSMKTTPVEIPTQ